MEANFENFEIVLDPYKLREVTFIPYEQAGFTLQEVARLCVRGLEVQCFRVPGDAESKIRMNFPVIDGTPTSRIRDAYVEGKVSEYEFGKFFIDARYLESDTSFNTTWSDFI